MAWSQESSWEEKSRKGGVEAWTGEVWARKGVYLSLAQQPATHHGARGIGDA